MLRRFTLNLHLMFYILFARLLHTRSNKEHEVGCGRPMGGRRTDVLENFTGSHTQEVTHAPVVCLLNRDSLCPLLKIVVAACHVN